jgi:hypothetical protein
MMEWKKILIAGFLLLLIFEMWRTYCLVLMYSLHLIHIHLVPGLLESVKVLSLRKILGYWLGTWELIR